MSREMVPIETSFGFIRLWSAEDAPALLKYADNRKIWINLRDVFPHPYTAEDARVFLGMAAKQDPTTIFALATSEEAIGSIGISPGRDVERLTGELGYWLAEPFWGRGIMTETVAKFADFAFERFGLVRIFAEPYEYNPASHRVLEKAGFLLEGRLLRSAIKDGRIVDQRLYARTRVLTAGFPRNRTP